MTHAFRYVGLALAVFILLFTTFVVEEPVETLPSKITANEEEAPITALPIPFAPSATTTTATSTAPVLPNKSSSRTTQPSTPPPVSSTPVAASPTNNPPTSNVSASLDLTASALRNALVNIVCYAPAGSRLRSISGTGVIIDPKGIILTNAHVAQHFLLAERGVSCSVRTGGPAKTAYKAGLIFISPAWIQANAQFITKSAAAGTGEFDFALLAITATATETPLPALFPFVPLSLTSPPAATPVVIASYGAQFLASAQVQSALFPTVVFGSVKELFTFSTNTADVLALGGSAAAQEGSSGGGVATADGVLVGTITTSTIEGDTSTRSLNALSAAYIRAEYAAETGRSLSDLILQSPQVSVSEFIPQAPALTALLAAQL